MGIFKNMLKIFNPVEYFNAIEETQEQLETAKKELLESITSRNTALLNYTIFVKCIENKEFVEDSYNLLKERIKEKYNIPIFDLSKEEMSSTDANGTFHYIEGESVKEMQEYSKYLQCKYQKLTDDILKRSCILPRIEIQKNRDTEHKLITLAHEVGHLLIHIRNEEQSEELANKYISDVIKDLLGDFHLAAFSVLIKIYNGKYPIENIEDFYHTHYKTSPLIEKYSFNIPKLISYDKK